MTEYIIDFTDTRFEIEPIEHNGEIVRCRDCKFRSFDECTRIDEGFKDYWFTIEPDGFCAWGKRKEADE